MLFHMQAFYQTLKENPKEVALSFFWLCRIYGHHLEDPPSKSREI